MLRANRLLSLVLLGIGVATSARKSSRKRSAPSASDGPAEVGLDESIFASDTASKSRDALSWATPTRINAVARSTSSRTFRALKRWSSMA